MTGMYRRSTNVPRHMSRAVPDKLTVRRGPAVCIPWADIEQIILYPTYPRGQGGYARVQCIGIQRRPGSPALAGPTSKPLGAPASSVLVAGFLSRTP
jgi:hypothetical protein